MTYHFTGFFLTKTMEISKFHFWTTMTFVPGSLRYSLALWLFSYYLFVCDVLGLAKIMVPKMHKSCFHETCYCSRFIQEPRACLEPDMGKAASTTACKLYAKLRTQQTFEMSNNMFSMCRGHEFTECNLFGMFRALLFHSRTDTHSRNLARKQSYCQNIK